MNSDDTPDSTAPDTPAAPAAPEARKPRRWPRRVAVGVLVTGAMLGAAYWYLGRETTLQTIVSKVAAASGGKIVVEGVTGSLYGAMHIRHAVYKTPDQVVTLDNIDIDWSPWQYLSKGIAINELHVAQVKMDKLRETEPAKMPATLAPPFTLAVNDARIAKLIMTQPGGAAPLQIDDIRFNLHSDRKTWVLSGASAVTPWGVAKLDGSIATSKPFKLNATASFTQSGVKTPARLSLKAGGDLQTTLVDADGLAGRAHGSAHLALAPFAPIPLQSMQLHAKNINPDIFNPALPTADLSMDIDAAIRPDRTVAGSVAIENLGELGPVDKQRLPLRSLRARLDGNLNALRLSDVLADLGAAGRFTGSGSVERAPTDKGIGGASFALHTERLDLRQLYSSMKATSIAGDIRIASDQTTQTLTANLVDKGMRLQAQASLADQVVTIREARIGAGASTVRVTGSMGLAGDKPFKLAASASKFNPAAFGEFPSADINADINAAGALAPGWRVAADFALRPSRLFDQPLSGKGKLNADAKHVSNVAADLALGKNSLALHGAFGAPGEKLAWQVDGRDLSLARPGLYGSVTANGVVSGSMEQPRTTFVVDGKGLGWVKGANAANGLLHAAGEAALGAAVKEGARSVAIKASGSTRALNPAAFGSPLAGAVNARFDLSGQTGGQAGGRPRGTVDLTIDQSTLSNAPLFGHAKLSADERHVSNADVDLHVGANLLAAKGAYGLAGDRLDWRIDAPQLQALGPDYAGLLRGAGTLTGTLQAPALTASVEGSNLKVLGRHKLRSLRASANIGAGRGAADPLVLDAELLDYRVADQQQLASARLQSTGTVGAHTIHLAARGDALDTVLDVRGGYAGGAWNGTIGTLQNRGRYAFTLQAPVPLRVAGAPGTGLAGLAKPQQLSLGNAVLALPAGTLNIDGLSKNGPRWTSKGGAAGVPLQYLAQFSPTIADNLRGDLALGAQWNLDLHAAPTPGAAPRLDGMVHVYRERGDVIAGIDVPVVLGLRTLDLRADVANGALRLQGAIDGTRAGNARVDATAQMINGRLGTASPLRMTASADMGSIAWLAPLAGQPGLELDGALKMALTGGGTVGVPTLNGSVNGDNLAVRWSEQGLKLRNGQLRAQLTGDSLVLQRLSFDGNQGRAVADGSVRFSGGEATMQLKLVADKLEALSRPDRTVVLTGQAALVRDAKRFDVTGKFRADRALVELAPLDRPTISDDVIVLGRTSAAAPAREKTGTPLSVDLEADLGDAFRLRGMGIDAELKGTLHLRMAGGRPPRINGGISVANGTYKAYGQNLTIERGVLTFSGPYDNPSLNILAVRRRPEGEQLSETNVEAGVQVRGTALAPVAKLVSTPSVPDSEKLSWLVLGHGMEGTSGNEAGVLSAAAGALLGGSGKGGGFQSRVANALGLDELGLRQAAGLESTVVTVGKKLSSRAYLTFEQGAATATSLVKLRYKLNPRVTLQLQTGTNTALDVLYSWAFD
ncbi:MAG: translocation/assembly module TamB domain-containing protein [Gammaproteobacteria bacterium]